MKKHDAVLWLLFVVFVAIRMTCKMPYWIVLCAETFGLAISLLVKTGMPSAQNRILAVAFAVISTVAYLGYERNPWILLYGLRAGIPTLLCSLAVFAVMEKRDGLEILAKNEKHPVRKSIMIALVLGAVLSVINFFLSGEEACFEFSWWKVLLCLNPAIYEEMACRAIFFAFCIWHSDGEKSIFQRFTMYFMACVPHAAVHGFPLLQTMVLCALFGLPFAILQKKRDITSAMISHGLVDAVRFMVTGI